MKRYFSTHRRSYIFEKIDSCSWLYIRNVSELHRPIFLIIVSGMPLRCITVAPPDRKLCVLTRLAWTPTSLSLSNRTLSFRALVMVRAEIACSSPFGVTNKLMMWFWKSRDKRALLNLCRIAMIGHVITAGWSFGNLWCVIGEPLTPAFWFARHSVTAVHRQQSSVYEEKMLNLLVPSHSCILPAKWYGLTLVWLGRHCVFTAPK